MSNVIQMLQNAKEEKGSDTITVCTKKMTGFESIIIGMIRERKISPNALVGS